MKNLKIILTVVCTTILMSAFSFAQDTTIVIKTSAQCGSCKKRIENGISFEKGVKQAVLDLDTKNLTVTYDSKKNSSEKLKTALTKIGYDSDEMPADEKAYKKLPKCCQKGSGCKAH